VGRLADLGHRIDERDLGSEERVRGDLYQLRRREICHDDRDALVDHRSERGPKRVLASLRGHAEDQPVRAQRVLDRETFAQELGIPDQLHVPAGRRDLGNVRGDPLRSADRNGRLAGQHA